MSVVAAMSAKLVIGYAQGIMAFSISDLFDSHSFPLGVMTNPSLSQAGRSVPVGANG